MLVLFWRIVTMNNVEVKHNFLCLSQVVSYFKAHYKFTWRTFTPSWSVKKVYRAIVCIIMKWYHIWDRVHGVWYMGTCEFSLDSGQLLYPLSVTMTDWRSYAREKINASGNLEQRRASEIQPDISLGHGAAWLFVFRDGTSIIMILINMVSIVIPINNFTILSFLWSINSWDHIFLITVNS